MVEDPGTITIRGHPDRADLDLGLVTHPEQPGEPRAGPSKRS